eukprot:6357679-Amphidinium_carterae.1
MSRMMLICQGFCSQMLEAVGPARVPAPRCRAREEPSQALQGQPPLKPPGLLDCVLGCSFHCLVQVPDYYVA